MFVNILNTIIYKNIFVLYIYIHILSKDLKDFIRINWFILTKHSNFYVQIVFKVITHRYIITGYAKSLWFWIYLHIYILKNSRRFLSGELVRWLHNFIGKPNPTIRNIYSSSHFRQFSNHIYILYVLKTYTYILV